MNFTLSDAFEYRHKKFDQSKRKRSNSSSSSAADDCIKLEIGIINESPSYETTFQQSATLDWSTNESDIKTTISIIKTEMDISTQPPAKRPRLYSFIPSREHRTSTPVPVAATAAAAVVPPAATILPKISKETLNSICKYHGNMVRKFPKKERTPRDQERRNKNTIACRMSRRVKKLEHIAIEEQYKEFSEKTFDIIEKFMRATAYLHELIKLKPQEGGACVAQMSKMLNERTSAMVQQKKPFTIAFLTGNE